MADTLYLSLWYPNLRLEALPDKLTAVLGAFAAHGGVPRVYAATVWPVSWSEPPVFQQVWGRRITVGGEGETQLGEEPRTAVEAATELLHEDYAYEFQIGWNLWEFEAAPGHAGPLQQGQGRLSTPLRSAEDDKLLSTAQHDSNGSDDSEHSGQQQILRLTTPRLKSTPGAPFAQDDKHISSALDSAEDDKLLSTAQDDSNSSDDSEHSGQQQILRLTTPRLKSTPGAPFAQDDKHTSSALDSAEDDKLLSTAQDDSNSSDDSEHSGQQQILRLTTPRLKSTPGAPFAQDDKHTSSALDSAEDDKLLSTAQHDSNSSDDSEHSGQQQILRLTTPRLKSTPGAPFAQDDKHTSSALDSAEDEKLLSTAQHDSNSSDDSEHSGQQQILRLTTPRLKSTPGAPFAQDDKHTSSALDSAEDEKLLSAAQDDSNSSDDSEHSGQQQILRLTTPRLKSTPGAPFAQDDKHISSALDSAEDDKLLSTAQHDSNSSDDSEHSGQQQILRLTTPRLKSTPGAPFAQDDKHTSSALDSAEDDKNISTALSSAQDGKHVSTALSSAQDVKLLSTAQDDRLVGRWVRGPRLVRVTGYGPLFDEGAYEQDGHIRIDLGPDGPFLEEDVDLGQVGARHVEENVRQLVELAGAVEKASGATARLLWSELGESLAQRLAARLGVSN